MLKGIKFKKKNYKNMKLKIAKRVFSAVTVLTASLAQFTFCDSREDWFAKEGEAGDTFFIQMTLCTMTTPAHKVCK